LEKLTINSRLKRLPVMACLREDQRIGRTRIFNQTEVRP
jgi:hypothetical protein